MSNSKQQVSYGSTHAGVGVSRYGPPKEVYEPSKHNKVAPPRVGSMDALRLPSLDPAGERRPYWGTVE